MTIQEILAQTATRLEHGGLESARFEAEWIISDLLGISRTELFLQADEKFPRERSGRLEDLIAARLDGQPLQYLLGYTEFYGRRFKCDPRALIPRPETEILVGEVLSYLQKCFPPQESVRPPVWDVGTGCGNIAVSLAGERPDLWVLATDIDWSALQLAGENINANQVAYRVALLQNSLLDAIQPARRFTAICANPPYVAPGEKDILPREVRDFEPHHALFAPEGGLSLLAKIIFAAKDFLIQDGLLALEIGYDQADAVRELFAARSEYMNVKLTRDLTGHQRVATAVRI